MIARQLPMMNIVVPMAGRGSRFQREGYDLPKPLIPVLGKPMIQLVINNLRPKTDHRFIFVCLKEHIDKYHIDWKLKEWAPGAELVAVDGITEGAACTVLLARDWIDNDSALMIANSDQWVDVDIDAYLEHMLHNKADGLIMTMWADHPKWSFVRFDQEGNPCEVVEKEVVSNEATVGVYNFRRGKDFVNAAESMIQKNLRVNNEFYVAPAYNEMISRGLKIDIYNVGKVYSGMYGMGVPEDLRLFEKLPACKRAVNF